MNSEYQYIIHRSLFAHWETIGDQGTRGVASALEQLAGEPLSQRTWLLGAASSALAVHYDADLIEVPRILTWLGA